jgi:hypothetical protein
MSRRTVILAVAAAVSACAVVPAVPAQAETDPTPNLMIVAAQLAGATDQSHHIRVALRVACSPGKFDTDGLEVTSAAPKAVTEDALECTNQTVTDLVSLTSNKVYKMNTPVTITATLRSTDHKMVLTGTRTITVQQG